MQCIVNKQQEELMSCLEYAVWACIHYIFTKLILTASDVHSDLIGFYTAQRVLQIEEECLCKGF